MVESEGVEESASKDKKGFGILRDPSFSGWCDEDGILHPARIETEEVSEEEFDFELPLVPENRTLDRQGLNSSRFRLKMESGGDISKASSNGTRNDSYVAFDIEGGQAIDRRDVSRTAGLNCADRDGVIKPKAQHPVSVADVLKTLFFILVWYTFSTFLTV